MSTSLVQKSLSRTRPERQSGHHEEIEIYFNFLGRYIPRSLQLGPFNPGGTGRTAKKEERNTGSSELFERKAKRRTKTVSRTKSRRRKAGMDAKKALIRADYTKKGVFLLSGATKRRTAQRSIAASAEV